MNLPKKQIIFWWDSYSNLYEKMNMINASQSNMYKTNMAHSI